MRWAASLSKRGDKGSIGGGMGTAWAGGTGAVGQLGTRKKITHPEYTWINDKHTNLQMCWPA